MYILNLYIYIYLNGGLDSIEKILSGEFNQSWLFTTYDQEVKIQSQIRQWKENCKQTGSSCISGTIDTVPRIGQYS